MPTRKRYQRQPRGVKRRRRELPSPPGKELCAPCDRLSLRGAEARRAPKDPARKGALVGGSQGHLPAGRPAREAHPRGGRQQGRGPLPGRIAPALGGRGPRRARRRAGVGTRRADGVRRGHSRHRASGEKRIRGGPRDSNAAVGTGGGAPRADRMGPGGGPRAIEGGGIRSSSGEARDPRESRG